MNKRWMTVLGLGAAGFASVTLAAGPTGPATPQSLVAYGPSWLGVVALGAPCPSVVGWTLAPAASPALARFCEYRPHLGTIGPLEHIAFERTDPAEVGRVLTQSGGGPQTPLAARMAPALSILFSHHANIPPAPARIPATPNVRLAIVDTVPHGAPAPRSVHGPTVAEFARAMTCSNGACAVDLAQHLGLPRYDLGSIDLVNGGHYATLWDLARGIAEAVDRAPQQEKLVINLSLGWDPNSDPSLGANHAAMILGRDTTIAAGTRAVHAALVHAWCKGALVFAAAGNDEGGRASPAQPLLPARWATLPVPATNVCAAAPTSLLASSMVVAVGSVDSNDELLESARAGSTPELVAPGSGAAVFGSAILTGTSVGTIVASSVASLVWTIDPQLSADQVLATLRASADTLPILADFCAGPGPCGPLRRISVCQAQSAACEASGACPIIDCSSPFPRPFSRPVEVFLEGASGLVPESLVHVQSATTSCGLTFELVGTQGSPICPETLPWAARQLDVGPQPVKGACPACGSGGGGSQNFVAGPVPFWFLLDLVSALPGGRIEHPYVRLVGDNGVSARYALPTPLLAGHARIYLFDVAGAGFLVERAWLEYEMVRGNERYFTADPLLRP